MVIDASGGGSALGGLRRMPHVPPGTSKGTLDLRADRSKLVRQIDIDALMERARRPTGTMTVDAKVVTTNEEAEAATGGDEAAEVVVEEQVAAVAAAPTALAVPTAPSTVRTTDFTCTDLNGSSHTITYKFEAGEEYTDELTLEQMQSAIMAMKNGDGKMQMAVLQQYKQVPITLHNGQVTHLSEAGLGMVLGRSQATVGGIRVACHLHRYATATSTSPPSLHLRAPSSLTMPPTVVDEQVLEPA